MSKLGGECEMPRLIYQCAGHFILAQCRVCDGVISHARCQTVDINSWIHYHVVWSRLHITMTTHWHIVMLIVMFWVTRYI